MAVPRQQLWANWQIYVTHISNACSVLWRIHVQYCHKISHILHYDTLSRHVDVQIALLFNSSYQAGLHPIWLDRH